MLEWYCDWVRWHRLHSNVEGEMHGARLQLEQKVVMIVMLAEAPGLAAGQGHFLVQVQLLQVDAAAHVRQ